MGLGFIFFSRVFPPNLSPPLQVKRRLATQALSAVTHAPPAFQRGISCTDYVKTPPLSPSAPSLAGPTSPCLPRNLASLHFSNSCRSLSIAPRPLGPFSRLPSHHPSSAISNSSSLRPPSTTSGMSWSLLSSASVKWDEEGLKTVKEMRKDQEECHQNSSNWLDSEAPPCTPDVLPLSSANCRSTSTSTTKCS